MLEVTGVSVSGGDVRYSFNDGSIAILKSVKTFTGNWALSADSSVTEEQWKAITAFKSAQKGNVL